MKILLIWSIVIFLLLGCGKVDPCQEKEIYRKTSQDGIVDAVLVERDCGATTSVSSLIYIVKKGDPTKKQEQVFVADHVQDLEVVWSKPKHLLISYAEARIFNYTNFWQSRDVDDFSYVVEIREIPLSPHALSPQDRWETGLPGKKERKKK